MDDLVLSEGIKTFPLCHSDSLHPIAFNTSLKSPWIGQERINGFPLSVLPLFFLRGEGWGGGNTGEGVRKS